MKKLMIAAASVAMIGAAQAEELCFETIGSEGCAVYNLKFTMKTLAAKRQSCTGAWWLLRGENTPLNNQQVWYSFDKAGVQISAATILGDHKLLARANREVYWADNATRTLDGLMWQCEQSCFEGVWANGLQNGNGRLFYAIWEKKSQTLVSYPVYRYYANKAKTIFGWVTRDAQNDFWFLGRYGQKATKVGAVFAPGLMRNQWINAAGFGTFDAKGAHIKSVSGNAVGALRPLNTKMNICGPETFFVQIAPMCREFLDWCCPQCFYATELVPASGTWSIKYNSSLSKGNKSLAKLLPSYVVFGPNFANFAFVRTVINAFLGTAYPLATMDARGYIDFTAYMADDEKETMTTDEIVEAIFGDVLPEIEDAIDNQGVYELEKDDDGNIVIHGDEGYYWVGWTSYPQMYKNDDGKWVYPTEED